MLNKVMIMIILFITLQRTNNLLSLKHISFALMIQKLLLAKNLYLSILYPLNHYFPRGLSTTNKFLILRKKT